MFARTVGGEIDVNIVAISCFPDITEGSALARKEPCGRRGVTSLDLGGQGGEWNIVHGGMVPWTIGTHVLLTVDEIFISFTR